MTSLSDRLAAARRATDGDTTGKHAAPTAQASEPLAGPGPAVAVADPAPEPLDPPATQATQAARPADAVPARAARPEKVPDAPVAQRRTIANQQQHERLEELKAHVHAELLKELGPQLYDADMDQDELSQKVRGVLADVLGSQERAISNATGRA